MRDLISGLRTRGAVILGHGAMLKVLIWSVAILVVAFIAVALIYL
jgi:hypothetical protein